MAANNANPQIKIQYQGSTPRPSQKALSESSIPYSQETVVNK
jgi:hypothetical protein